MIDPNIKENFDVIIKEYLQQYDKIDKDVINFMVDNLCWLSHAKQGIDCKHYKIVNNKLYFCGEERFKEWETRREAFHYMMLETLKEYKIDDCEFVLYDEDGINETTYPKCLYNNKQVPLIISTSVLDKYNMILIPDFTYSFAPEYVIKNNEQMCREVVEFQKDIEFKDKIPQMVWRGGSGSSGGRSHYLRNDTLYNIQPVSNPTHFRGQCGPMFTYPNSITRKDKSKYKYLLHLNGHNGTSDCGAYSNAFKYALMSKSLVFYSGPAFYREFWLHPSICREKEHFVYTTSVQELDEKYSYYRNHEDEAEKIATNGFEFFKKYLLEYSVIKYYVQKLFNEYAKKMTYTVTIDENDHLITSIKYCKYLME